MMKLLERLAEQCHNERLVERGDKLLLAVSGGLDSVALLDLFFKLKDTFELELSVIHVHHGIRGEEADADLRFVQKLALRYGLRFYKKKVDAIKLTREQGLSLEEAARILRYQAFAGVLDETGYTKVATAHTANDQAETILDHLLRGSGHLGLSGMSRKREAYMRPLLKITREELRTYVNEHGLSYRQDSSNEDLRYKRNRIRKELIPYLEKYFNGNVIQTLNRTSEIFFENEQFLTTYADNAFKSLVSIQKKNEIILEIKGFLSYFNIIRKYIVFRACLALSIARPTLTFDKLKEIIQVIEQGKIGKKVQLGSECELFVDHDGIVLKKKSGQPPKKVSVDVLSANSVRFENYRLSWSVFRREQNVALSDKVDVECVDFEKTGKKLVLRSFVPGDRFIPLNFHGRKKVADYFSDCKIPHHIRDTIPILESPKGIVWVCGYMLDDRFKITEETQKILKLEIEELPDECRGHNKILSR